MSDIHKALLAAQKEFPSIPKDKTNPHFKSKYSSLDAIQSAIWPVLNKHGIFARHETTVTDGKLTVDFVLTHADSGEQIRNPLTVEAGATVQALGSQITYLRRYTAAPALGITSDEDDDGHAASQSKKPPQRPQQQPAKAKETFAPPIDWPDTDIHDIKAWIDRLSTKQDFVVAFGILKSEPSLTSNIADWEPVLNHFAGCYKKHYQSVGSHDMNDSIKAALDQLATDKQGIDVFQGGSDE